MTTKRFGVENADTIQMLFRMTKFASFKKAIVWDCSTVFETALVLLIVVLAFLFGDAVGFLWFVTMFARRVDKNKKDYIRKEMEKGGGEMTSD